MQIILPVIYEATTNTGGAVPLPLQGQVLPLAERSVLQGPWGSVLVQHIARKDYTVWLYAFHITGNPFSAYALKAQDGHGLLACLQGELGGPLELETHEAVIAWLAHGPRHEWALGTGVTVILHVDLDDAFGNVTDAVKGQKAWLSRKAQAILYGLKENLSLQAAPELYLDGVVADLLQEHLVQVQEQADNRFLDNPPFHFTAKDLAATRRAKAILDATGGKSPSIKSLAALAQTNTDIIKKGFRHVYGQTVHQYWLAQSLEQARELLLQAKLPVKAVAAACGFGNYPHFIQQFKKRFGATPGRYRKTL